jgi:hypothetical protein
VCGLKPEPVRALTEQEAEEARRRAPIMVPLDGRRRRRFG